MSLRVKFFALIYDWQMAKSERAGLGSYRRDLLADASGRLLEIGGGTGANLRWYGGTVKSLMITEPEVSMLKRLQRKMREQSRDAKALRAAAEDLPFTDNSFDTVVSTLVLCSVDDQPRAVRELRRVLRPGGKLVFLEHLRSDDPKTGRLQDRMNGLNRFMVCCDCNRATLRTIEGAGFTVKRISHVDLPRAPKFVRPSIMGTAVAPGDPGYPAGTELSAFST